VSADDAEGVLLHHRTLDFEAFDQGEEILVVGRLRDGRPWAAAEGAGPIEVHDMELRVRVQLADLTIVGCEAVMHTFPHAECPAIAPAFAELAGLRVGRGFTRAVQDLVAGPNGCTHLDQLARAVGPVVVQAVTSRRARLLHQGHDGDLLTGVANAPWARNTCHVWAEGGVAEAKLAAGWRPGRGPYPAPPLDQIVSGSGDGNAGPERPGATTPAS
jgi:hypothetical protein